MDYRKMVNNKKKFTSTIENIKNFAIDKSKEVKNYTDNTVEDLKTNVKNTTQDIKTNITTSIKDKLTNEFRKNYPIYALNFVDDILVNSFSNDITTVVISKVEKENSVSIQDIIYEIASGMIDDEVREIYLKDNVVDLVFDYLATYYETEKQLDVIVLEDTIKITLKINQNPIEEILNEEDNTISRETEIEETKEEVKPTQVDIDTSKS